ncbi:MAG: hypothetical protein BWY31_01916 [Lentisphaerae bacterium ADurb.Bin242]|nr:MAG: hypothetical protein BWY31_01916 [Lentisphaerae bacterium ADurb.Bin242]
MNRKHIVLLILAALSAPLPAADFTPVKTEVKQVHVYRPEQYSLRQGALLSNQLTRYALTLTQTKSDGTKAPQTAWTLDAGKFGFSPLVGFFKLKVNGIEMNKLSPKAEDLTVWRDGQLAGCELKLNYDGAKLILRFYLRPDSPVLWGVLLPAQDSVEPTQKAEVEISLIPSKLAMDGKKVIWNGGYERMAVTPARTIEQNPKRIALTPADAYLVIQDKKFDGSTPDNGQGPCLILLDYDAVQNAALRVNDDWTSGVSLTLKPDFKEFKFGLWQQEPRISNADFAKKLETEKTAFTR